MLFNSVPFAIFLPAVLAIYWLLRTPRRQNSFLVVASLFFYGWWNPIYLILLLFSLALNFFMGEALTWSLRARRQTLKRGLLTLGVALNLGLLGYFKYANFFVGEFRDLLLLFGGQSFVWRQIALPIGISFFTFQKITYIVDVYRRQPKLARQLRCLISCLEKEERERKMVNAVIHVTQ